MYNLTIYLSIYLEIYIYIYYIYIYVSISIHIYIYVTCSMYEIPLFLFSFPFPNSNSCIAESDNRTGCGNFRGLKLNLCVFLFSHFIIPCRNPVHVYTSCIYFGSLLRLGCRTILIKRNYEQPTQE